MSYAFFMPSYEVLIFICVVFAFILISLKVIYEVNNSKQNQDIDDKKT